MLDFLHPDRIVVGVDEPEAEAQLRELYRPIVEQSFACRVHAKGCPPQSKPRFLVTGINSAELIKHACNSFLALKISYANLVADLCERLGADIDEVSHAMGMDPRIGPHFLTPGLGFGGFCLPKDIRAFIRLGERAGVDVSLLESAEAINKQRIEQFCGRMRELLWVLKDKRIAVLGLAFKPNTDDVRFAPALDLISRLTAEGARVQAYDPQAMSKASALLPGVSYCRDAYEAAEKADGLVIATEWPEFRKLDWAVIREHMLRPLVLDGRNLLQPAAMKGLGFEYHSVGRRDSEVAAEASKAAFTSSQTGG